MHDIVCVCVRVHTFVFCVCVFVCVCAPVGTQLGVVMGVAVSSIFTINLYDVVLEVKRLPVLKKIHKERFACPFFISFGHMPDPHVMPYLWISDPYSTFTKVASDVMRVELDVISEHTYLKDIVRLLSISKHSSFPVIDSSGSPSMLLVVSVGHSCSVTLILFSSRGALLQATNSFVAMYSGGPWRKQSSRDTSNCAKQRICRVLSPTWASKKTVCFLSVAPVQTGLVVFPLNVLGWSHCTASLDAETMEKLLGVMLELSSRMVCCAATPFFLSQANLLSPSYRMDNHLCVCFFSYTDVWGMGVPFLQSVRVHLIPMKVSKNGLELPLELPLEINLHLSESLGNLSALGVLRTPSEMCLTFLLFLELVFCLFTHVLVSLDAFVYLSFSQELH